MAFQVPMVRLGFDRSVLDSLARVLQSGWIAQGKSVTAFEERFAVMAGADYAVAVSSGTMALYVCLLALDLPGGTEVICPSHSFVATANAVRLSGLIPRFVDVDIRSFNLLPGEVEQAVGPNTGAILPVHQLGLPCAMDAILDIAARKGIPVIEDAACALGSFWEGRMAGTLGLAGCFSFHPRKVLTTGEGGMVVTNDPSFARKVRALRNHGIDMEQGDSSCKQPGLNGRMTDLQAELGLWGLLKVSAWVKERRDIASRFNRSWAGLSGLNLPWDVPPSRHNFQSYCVTLSDGCPVSRDILAQRLGRAGIATRMGIRPIHRQPAYMGEGSTKTFPNTEWLEESSLFLPVFPGMREEEIQGIVDAMEKAFES